MNDPDEHTLDEAWGEDDRCCGLDTSDGVTYDHCTCCHLNISVAVQDCPRCEVSS